MVTKREPKLFYEGPRASHQIVAETTRDALVKLIEFLDRNHMTDCEAINISADPTGPGVLLFFYTEA